MSTPEPAVALVTLIAANMVMSITSALQALVDIGLALRAVPRPALLDPRFVLEIMAADRYTPGHTQNAVEFMSRRTLASHGRFFLPYLVKGVSVLDCGCGPGTITLGIGAEVAPGSVIGVDFAESQVEVARTSVAERGMRTVAFLTADCRALPFSDGSFERVFSHALLEHLSDPGPAVSEFYRVLKPGGIIGLSSPDWGGFILAPSSAELARPVQRYVALQPKNGGDVEAGRKLGIHLERAGFREVQLTAQYECYPTLPLIGEYLALQLEHDGDRGSARILREWSHGPGGLFAQAWVSAIAKKDPR